MCGIKSIELFNTDVAGSPALCRLTGVCGKILTRRRGVYTGWLAGSRYWSMRRSMTAGGGRRRWGAMRLTCHSVGGSSRLDQACFRAHSSEALVPPLKGCPAKAQQCALLFSSYFVTDTRPLPLLQRRRAEKQDDLVSTTTSIPVMLSQPPPKDFLGSFALHS
jgi:hypothetical protein